MILEQWVDLLQQGAVQFTCDVSFVALDGLPDHRQHGAVIGQANEQRAAFLPGLCTVNQQISRFIAQTGLHREHERLEELGCFHFGISHPPLKATHDAQQTDVQRHPQGDLPELHMPPEKQAGDHQR